jgi:hypothetical protein
MTTSPLLTAAETLFDNLFDADNVNYKDIWTDDPQLVADQAAAVRLAGPGTPAFTAAFDTDYLNDMFDEVGAGHPDVTSWLTALYTTPTHWEQFGDGTETTYRWSCWVTPDFMSPGILIVTDLATGDQHATYVTTN